MALSEDEKLHTYPAYLSAVRVKTVISGLHLNLKGRVSIPIPRLTYRLEFPSLNQPFTYFFQDMRQGLGTNGMLIWPPWV